MARAKKPRFVEGEYVLVDQRTGKMRGRSFKRLDWAEAHRHHLEVQGLGPFQIAKLVRK